MIIVTKTLFMSGLWLFMRELTLHRYIDFPLTPQELRNVGSALACSKFVQSLYLVNNDIGSDGGEVLGEAMKLNDTLVTLR